MSSSNQAIRVERVEGTVMPVNSSVVEGPSGVVIIDGQLTVSDAAAVRRVVDRIGRPVAGLLVTYPHPDHYAAAGVLLDGLGSAIYATAAVAGIITGDDEEKDSIVGPMMGDEWPASRRFPDEVLPTDGSIELAGMEIDVRSIGPGESHADVLFSIGEETVFTGDLAYHDFVGPAVDALDRWMKQSL